MTDVSNTAPTTPFVNAPAPGKSCGSCMLCCKLFAIRSLDKPMGVWCGHARQGKGCGIYDDRPDECRIFHCDWLLDPSLGPEWKPDKTKFFINRSSDGNAQILVDPGAASAWKDPRYYPAIKVYAARLAESGKNLFVVIGRRIIVVLPDRDHDAGLIPAGHVVHVTPRSESGRIVHDVRVIPAPSMEAAG